MSREDRHFIGDLTDVMARTLYYQEYGEPSVLDMTAADATAEYTRLPDRIVLRYRNDMRFHAQVTRAVALVIEAVKKRDQALRDAEAAERITRIAP